ncbi:MAG: histone H1 [Candidatus Limnocylindrales bacterium]
MPKRSRMPRDPNQLAKAVVDFATGQREPDPTPPVKNAAAVELGRMGGKIGGKRRAERMTAEERRDSARRAALARWSKQD